MADMPTPGEGFTDARGRVLHVREVNPGDPFGREVIGARTFREPDDIRTRVVFVDYACPLTTWAQVWRDKAQPLPAEQMRIG